MKMVLQSPWRLLQPRPSFPLCKVQKIWISGSVEGSYSNGGEYICRATNLNTRQACKVDVLVFKKLVV